MTFPQHLRIIYSELYPELVPYSSTDPRIVDGVRLLEPAANELERLTKTVEILTKHADVMAKKLNERVQKESGNDNAVDWEANNYNIVRLYLDRGELPPEK